MVVGLVGEAGGDGLVLGGVECCEGGLTGAGDEGGGFVEEAGHEWCEGEGDEEDHH